MMKKKDSKAFVALRAFLFSISIFSMVSFSAPQAKADIWFIGAVWEALGEVFDQLGELIKGMMLGALKSAATQVLNDQINRLVGGTSAGKALFITNYQSFLYQEPLQKANLYMNDFFTLSTRGKGASANYISAGGTSGLGGNYSNYLIQQAKQATVDSSQSQPQMTLDQYTSSPEQMFQEGDWRAFNSFFSNPANNVFGYTIMAEQRYQGKLSSEQQARAVESQSSGFIGSKKDGQVVAPAGTIESIAGNVQSIGPDLIASATNMQEFIASAVASAAGQMVNKLVQQGVGQVQANIQKEVNSVKTEIGSAQDDAVRNGGPGAQFATSVTQRTGVNINPNAPAPPTPSNISGGCVSYGSSGNCQAAGNCANGHTKANCSGDLVCCYAPPTSTGVAAGGACTAYGQQSTCQLQGNCRGTYITTSACGTGLVCCYNP
jgi:hypothetical protein